MPASVQRSREENGPMRACVLVILLCACGGPSDPGDDGGTDAGHVDAGPLSAANFCDRYADAVCGARAACGCDTMGCRDEARAACGGVAITANVASAIARGTLTFDREAAEALLAGLEGVAPACEHPFAALEWEYGDVRTNGGVLDGTLDAGADCDPDLLLATECIDGWCADTDRDGVGTCIRYVGLGEPCDQTRRCFDLRAPIDSYDDLDDPSYWLACIGGTCVEQRALGESCDGNTDCESNRCEGEVCEPLLADAQPCTIPSECVSDRCEADVCTAPEASGGACDGANDCESDYCDAGSCAVPPARAAGEACVQPIECASGVCDGGRCAASAFCALGAAP